MPQAKPDTHPVIGIATYLCAKCGAAMLSTKSTDDNGKFLLEGMCLPCGVIVDLPAMLNDAPVLERRATQGAK